MRLLTFLCLVQTINVCHAQQPVIPIENLNGSIRTLNQVLDWQKEETNIDSFDLSMLKEDWRWSNATLNTESQWSFELNNFYASDRSGSYLGSGFFSDLAVEHRITLAGLPVRLFGGLVFQNGQINTRLSSLGVAFDHEALVNKYKARITKKTLQESFEQLPDDKQSLLQEYHKIEASRKILYSTNYSVLKDLLTQQIDSLSNVLQTSRDAVNSNTIQDLKSSSDSLYESRQAKQDSVLLDSLISLQKQFRHTEYRVDSIYNAGKSKWNEVQQILQDWETKILEQQDKVEEKLEVGAIHQYSQGYVGKEKWKAFLLNVSAFKVGSFRLQGSAFDVTSVPIHGVAFEIRRNGYYGALSYGKEGRQRSQLPDYVRNLRSQGEGRTILQAKAGIGVPERSHLHLVFTAIRASGSGDSTYLTSPKRNVLVGIESEYQISKQFFVEFTGSVSNADFSGTASNKELLGGMYDEYGQGKTNMAGLVRVGWRSKKGRSTYSIGYQTVGSNFVTLGNPYLLTNRNAIKVEGRQKLLHNRGQIKLSYTKGTTNSTTDIAPDVQQNQLSGELAYRLNKRGSRAWASYSPSFFVQNAPGVSAAVYQLNLTTLGTQWIFPNGKKGQWMTALQVANYADQSRYGDSSVVAGLWYGLLTQTYIAKRYSFTSLINVGFDQQDLRLIRDFNLDLSQSVTLKKTQITQGVQVVKRFFGTGILLGGSGGIQIKVHKQLRAGFSGSYLFGLSDGARNQFYINSSVSWQF